MEVRVEVGGEEEGGLGLQAMQGLVGFPTLLAGHFPPPFRARQGPPQGGRKGVESTA